MVHKNSVLYFKLYKFYKSSSSTGVNTRNTYDIPSFNKNVYKYSFTRLSTKILNLVLNNYINERVEKMEKGEKPIALKKYLLDKFNNDITRKVNDCLIDKLTGFVT
jgi:hypothetical protein